MNNLEEKFQNTYNLVFRPHHIYGEPKFKTKKCKLKKKNIKSKYQ